MSIRVEHFPNNTNPYLSMLISSLCSEGVFAQAFCGHVRLFWRSLTSSSDLLHLHWIHPVSRFPFVPIIRFVLLVVSVTLYKIRQKKVFWTVHNLSDHENRNPLLDRLAAKFVAKVADQIIVHGKTARPIVSDKLNVSENKIRVMYHGNYAPVVGKVKSKESARQMLGYNQDEKIALMFGKLRPYKGVSELLKVFKSLDEDVRLIVAGRADDESYKNKIHTIASQDFRVELRSGFIEQSELSALLSACNFVVLPFNDVFTSGSLLYSLTHSRPAVVPKMGLIEEYVDATCAYLYHRSDSNGLRNALIGAFDDINIGSKYEAAARLAKKFQWSVSARELAILYYESVDSVCDHVN